MRCRATRTDRVFVGSDTPNTLLVRNAARRNGDDGFDVESPSTTLRQNIAN